MRTRIPFVLVILAVFMTGPAWAQEPQEKPPRHPHPYDIQPDAGNYAICVISYMGDTAFQMAKDMVSELRAAPYKLPAYLYSRTEIDRQQEAARREAQRQQRLAFYQQNLLEAPKKVYYQKINIEDQYAVLVAAPAFKDLDTTRKHLDVIRKLDPQRLARLLNVKSVEAEGGSSDQVYKVRDNPFLTAFVVPNPVGAKPKAPPPDEKQEVISFRDWNSDESLSAVHKIPGKWTLVVRIYRCPVRILPQHQERSAVERAVSSGGRQGDLMDANAKAAHQLAEILRNPQLGFDSYVIHTPKMSIVTVGAFDSKDDVRMMGVTNSINKLHLNLQGGSMSSEQLEAPTPWQVPRR